MKTKTCSRCGFDRPHDEFNKKSRNKDGLQSTCRECQRAYKQQHYLDNREEYILKAGDRRNELKEIALNKIVEFLESNPCVDCGESDIRKLQFDHTRDKHRDVTVMIHGGYLWETIEEEIAKCEVRCANCHMVKTWPDRWQWKNKARSSTGRTSSFSD